jgi:hypothetical protein
MEKVFPGGIKSYIPKSLSPKKVLQNTDSENKDDKDKSPDHLKEI